MEQIRKTISTDHRMAKSTAWAITFADLTTLLLCFFVLLLVILNDAEKHIDRIINRLLNETYIELKENISSSYVQVDRVTKGIKITMRGKLFRSLSAEIDKSVYPILIQIGGIIRTSKLVNVFDDEKYSMFLDQIDQQDQFLNVEVRCEGHTDDKPVPPEAEFPSNWELSAARSLNIVRLLSQYAEMDEGLFSAMGYGEFRPIVDVRKIRNRAILENSRATNRRVEIYLDAFIKQKINAENI